MKRGAVRWYPKDRCPRCAGKFQSVYSNNVQVFIQCPTCLIPPRRFTLDCRGFGDRSGNRVGVLSRDRHGLEFHSWEHSFAVMSTIRDEARQDDGFVDVSRWAPSAMREVTLRAEGDKWVTEVYRERSKNYARRVESHLERHVYPTFGDTDVRDIKATHLHKFRESLYTKKFKPSTIASVMSVFGTLLDNLVKLEIIPRAPYSKPVEIEKDTRPYVERAEQQEILSHVDYNADVTLLLRVLIETGLRPGEGCALRVNSLRGEGWIEAGESTNQYGYTGPTKTGQIFNRVVSEELYSSLVAHAGERFGNEFLFRKKNNSPIRPTELSNIWRTAGEAAGRAIPLNHSMRHSRISQEINEKLRDEYRAKVRGILGHKSTVTALRYVRPKAGEEGGWTTQRWKQDGRWTRW